MRTLHRAIIALALLMGSGTAALAAPALKDGWTPKTLQQAVKACTDELVDGAWKNTKKDAGVNPDAPLTPEIRKEIQPQIDEFNKLCDCVVRKSAEKFEMTAYQKNGPEIDTYAVELIDKGTCKAPKR
ncbi:MAG TPA: hypothetical protein VGR62_03320 [Candidatus Binatia bacterium]|jgi:hypothetical protein|nr:hypothetical protein [Candidatus Binatia bacterium]